MVISSFYRAIQILAPSFNNNKKKTYLTLVIFASLHGRAQEQLFTEKDTITFFSRTGGEIDSMDMTYAIPLSTFPGGGSNFWNNSLAPLFLFNSHGLQNFHTLPLLKPMIFSAMPHIGFSYSFGSKGTQFLHFDYQQAFTKKTLINVDGYRNSSNGFLRNSAFKDNLVNLQLRHNDSFHSFLLQGTYGLRSTGLSGGVTDSSAVAYLGLELTPIAKPDGNSSVKLANANLHNYFNFLRDSVQSLGLVSKHQYEAVGRTYLETSSYVPNWNIDPNTTRDQYRLASIKNSGGMYLKTKTRYLDALILQRYWDFQNLGIHHSKSEIHLTSNYRWENRAHAFANDLLINVLGAGQEWSNRSSFQTRISKIKLTGHLHYEKKWPTPFQRFYYSNYYDYTTQNYQLQERLTSSLTTTYQISSLNLLQASVNNTLLRDNYFFIDSIWRNDTLNLVVINNITLTGHVQIKFIHFEPKIALVLTSNNFNYLPSTTIHSRVFIKKKMFRNKKMESVFGADFSWISSYNLLTYNTVMDAFIPIDSGNKFRDMMNLSAFCGFAIEEFRFYLRMENIAYFWNDKTNQVAVGYPIQKNFIRLGLTWDFFN